MAKKIFVMVALLLAGFLGYVAMQPSEYVISREILVKAPPQAVFPFLNNSRKADSWMPWTEVDHGVKMNFSGPDEGVGSTTSWDSEGKMGAGQAAVVESVPDQKVKTQLTYTKPFKMSQTAEMSLTPAAEGTVVRWSVTGQNGFVGRIFCVFMNMDKMVGANFEKGLAKLKKLVETPSAG